MSNSRGRCHFAVNLTCTEVRNLDERWVRNPAGRRSTVAEVALLSYPESTVAEVVLLSCPESTVAEVELLSYPDSLVSYSDRMAGDMAAADLDSLPASVSVVKIRKSCKFEDH
jgi:hypothetical protein